ncbi:MAG: 50S ribosomal protein L3 N(5)-glutamine methyltransferase [Magnetococcus sp. YQC-5]
MIVRKTDFDKNVPNPADPEKGGCSGKAKPDHEPKSVAGWIRYATERLEQAELCFANGMQEPYLEAEYLVLHTFSIPMSTPRTRRPKPPVNAATLIEAMLDQRIGQRLPAAYVTREAFFAGRVFYVDERVLIPRSRIENIMDDPLGFSPWLNRRQVRRILDLGTGSGCLAITLALMFPRARVDAVDVSAAALAVAEVNRQRFDLQQRVNLVRSDVFAGLAGQSYDLIVSNPPYVPQADFEQVPPEYRHEPMLALAAGADGLDLLGPMLHQAPDYLTPGGVLICETGDDVQTILMDRWPDLPLEWIPFHFGASGVFAVHKEPLLAWREQNNRTHS